MTLWIRSLYFILVTVTASHSLCHTECASQLAALTECTQISHVACNIVAIPVAGAKWLHRVTVCSQIHIGLLLSTFNIYCSLPTADIVVCMLQLIDSIAKTFIGTNAYMAVCLHLFILLRKFYNWCLFWCLYGIYSFLFYLVEFRVCFWFILCHLPPQQLP